MNIGQEISSFIAKGNSISSNSLVPAHLSQMSQFMTRQGLEFLPVQDSPDGSKEKLIQSTIKENRLDFYYNGIANMFCATGGILWLYQPSVNGSNIYWFHSGEENQSIEGVKSQYKIYHTPNGRGYQEVVIRYKYFDNSGNRAVSNSTNKEKWVRLRLKTDTITQEFFSAEPPLELYNPQGVMSSFSPAVIESQITYINTLGYIPCVESCNRAFFPGDSGRSDFKGMEDSIETEALLRQAIQDNIHYFGNPTLITSRDSSEVVQKLKNLSNELGWADRQGFKERPFSQMGSPKRTKQRWQDGMPKVIGNVGSDERFGYIAPDPVSPDQSRYVDQFRSSIHNSIGGIDPNDQSFATFGEVKSLYGKVAATANIKSHILWKGGLCVILEMVVNQEVKLYTQQFKEWLKTQDKKIDVDNVTNEQIENIVWGQDIQLPDFVGIPPYGTNEISYRYNGDVYEDSPRDKLDKSIYGRNLQELGMGSLEVVDLIFPNLSMKEKKAKLSGIPFRIAGQYLGLFSNILNLHQQMTQIEDPDNAGKALSLRYNMTELMDSIVSVLRREFSYGASYDEADNKYLNNANSGSTSTVPINVSSTPTGGVSIATSPDGRVLPFDWANPPISPNSSTVSSGQRVESGNYPNGGSTNPELQLRPASTQYSIPPTTVPVPTLGATSPVQNRPVRTKRKGRAGK